MKKTILYCLFFSLIFTSRIFAQGTFSIVAVDSVTGEVGSAGASCVDYVFYNLIPGRIGDPIPGIGAINTQASTNLTNQANARTRMLAGDSPQEIIDWLILNDVQNTPAVRQYGVVDLNSGSPRTAAHTGSSTSYYKNHILGPNYSIQGNILLGQKILDSMEVHFNAEQGSLACKLMAALQGAKVIGADARCTSKGTSALYAYVKVALPTDSIDNPSLFVGVKTSDTAGIEPIDSLQILFDAEVNCTPSGINDQDLSRQILIYPNPGSHSIKIVCIDCIYERKQLRISNLMGQTMFESGISNELSVNTSNWKKGVYIVQINNGATIITQKITIE
ncbi:MAG: DUF1028 domain-containing protein [Bacteroidetes bacterium]|nr:DUF1028 domain-containing protein [Bacteroidota bacterium]